MPEAFSKAGFIAVREMMPTDFNEVAAIYSEALEEGRSTFETTCPDYAAWDAAHCKDCRLVLTAGGRVAGWCALSPVSRRAAYRGVAEASVYIGRADRGRGVGRLLTKELCLRSERAGYWSLCGSVFASNCASMGLLRACGFREVGVRERIAKDRFGVWTDTVLFERRSKTP